MFVINSDVKKSLVLIIETLARFYTMKTLLGKLEVLVSGRMFGLLKENKLLKL